MDDNVLDGMIMDLDLNQEPPEQPPDSVLGFRSFLSNIESAHSRIEERIRHLEAVTARAWERHRWRRARNSSETDTLDGQIVIADSSMDVVGMSSSGGGRGCKRDSSHLVAKALALDSEVKKGHKEGGTFFDCNICLDMARDPVLTCCGHLYCWACFFRLPYVDSVVKECAVCKGEVSDGNVIPIYCNGSSNGGAELESGLNIPPRPKGRRVESVRQQQLSQGLSHIPVVEALRRIRASIGMMEARNQQEHAGNNVSVTTTSQEFQNAGQVRPPVFSRALSESAASLSTELDNAQRIFEDLAASITIRISQRSIAQSSSTTVDALQANETIASSSRGDEDSDVVVHLGNLVPTTTGERDQPLPRSSSSPRRRFSLLRFSDSNNEVARETRRRRLN